MCDSATSVSKPRIFSAQNNGNISREVLPCAIDVMHVDDPHLNGDLSWSSVGVQTFNQRWRCQRKPSTLRVSNAKNKWAIPAVKIRQPMISAIPKENVRGRIMARIPQTKVTVLQIINHGDAFFMAGAIDSMFIGSRIGLQNSFNFSNRLRIILRAVI
jgi:hypothetical protein